MYFVKTPSIQHINTDTFEVIFFSVQFTRYHKLLITSQQLIHIAHSDKHTSTSQCFMYFARQTKTTNMETISLVEVFETKKLVYSRCDNAVHHCYL